jgi:hypothetical protein
MPDELTPEDRKAVNDIFRVVSNQLAAGKSKASIVKKMVKQQIPEEVAAGIVDQVQRAISEYETSPEGRRAYAKMHARHMVYGALWVVGGTAVTLITYGAASSGGGTYIVAWGAILYGLFDFIRGLIGWNKYREKP